MPDTFDCTLTLRRIRFTWHADLQRRSESSNMLDPFFGGPATFFTAGSAIRTARRRVRDFHRLSGDTAQLTIHFDA